MAASSSSSTPTLLFVSLLLLSITIADGAARKLAALVTLPAVPMKYHDGPLLTGPIVVNLIFYGNFKPSQRAVLADFVSSLSGDGGGAAAAPSVASWWDSLDKYYAISKTQKPKISLGSQILDESCSLGKSLNDADIAALVSSPATSKKKKNSISVVITAADVEVEGFCMSRCAAHWSSPARKSGGGGRNPYVWVGNSEKQCPGQCAWPFHRPVYGPQSPPLVPPNGDVGVDGMVINLAAMLAGVATNPFGGGFYQGSAEAPMEAATACSGVYGSGAFPGYPGELLVDDATGASYNAVGGGRKFLVPAIFNPSTSQCSTLV